MRDFNVLTASDGVNYMEIMKQRRPDVVLCDVMMPRMDEYSLLQNTRSDEYLRTIPFIFLTARSSARDKRHAKGIGIDDYLVKPVETEDLTLAISNVLRREENILAQTKRQIDLLHNKIINALQHEFRTPLAFILGYAELLADGSTEELDVETLRTATDAILEGGWRLQSMIERFLLLADLQNRRQLPNTGSIVEVTALMTAQTHRFSNEAAEAGLVVSLECDVDDPTVLGDSIYIEEAIKRLVENAIQYRREESIRIQLVVLAEDSYLGVCVRDDGQGIPADKLAVLRNPFEQVDREDRAQPGIGLGLALVQQVARLHGGYFQIDSNEGEGSTFTLWLPLPPNAA